jgi:hypothetical protein
VLLRVRLLAGVPVTYVLPPTKTRLKLAEAIAAGKVRHYPFQVPQTFNQTNGGTVTDKVRLLLGAGLVEVPEPPPEYNYSIVRLTPEGEAWSGFKNRVEEGEGPGSTSPEPGPHQCPACPPELRCICDPTDLFDPPDPTPRVVAGCPAHGARGAYQRWATENRGALSTEDGAR